MKIIRRVLIIFLILLNVSLLSGCYYYKSEKTEIHHVKDYLIHDTGIEILSVSDNGEEIGFFVSEENIYPCEESSRVIAIRHAFINAFNFEEVITADLKKVYLYLNKEEFEEYIKTIYGLE